MTWVDPKSNDKCPHRRHGEEKTEEGHIKSEALTRVVESRSWGRQEGPSPGASEGARIPHT